MAASGPVGSPEYVALFNDGAEVVSGLVKEMFHNDDPRLVSLMASFPWTNLTPVLADRLWWSDFPLALLELVSDRKWYELLKVGLKRDVQHWDNVVPVAVGVILCVPFTFLTKRIWHHSGDSPSLSNA